MNKTDKLTEALKWASRLYYKALADALYEKVLQAEASMNAARILYYPDDEGIVVNDTAAIRELAEKRDEMLVQSLVFLVAAREIAKPRPFGAILDSPNPDFTTWAMKEICTTASTDNRWYEGNKSAWDCWISKTSVRSSLINAALKVQADVLEGHLSVLGFFEE